MDPRLQQSVLILQFLIFDWHVFTGVALAAHDFRSPKVSGRSEIDFP